MLVFNFILSARTLTHSLFLPSLTEHFTIPELQNSSIYVSELQKVYLLFLRLSNSEMFGQVARVQITFSIGVLKLH